MFSWLITKFTSDDKDDRTFALDVIKTIISAAGLIATVIAAIGLFVNYQEARQEREDARLDRQLTQERLITEQERLITDRFTKAVAQIGSSKEEVILGGIYSLERIAKDSPKDQWTIMEVLTAFVRTNSPISPEIKKLDDKPESKIKALEKLEPVNIQVQAALTVIRRRNTEQDDTQENKVTKVLDLNTSNLKDANLESATLIGANLISSNLSGANLGSANLSGAKLNYANLAKANLAGANLAHTDLNYANLADANLPNANLSEIAILRGANLVGAYLENANLNNAVLLDANLKSAILVTTNLERTHLEGANLEGTYLEDAQNLGNEQIKSACFWEKAIFAGSKMDFRERRWFIEDEQANQLKIEEIRQDKASDPQTPPDCSKWKLFD